jgi:hypothetical protein
VTELKKLPVDGITGLGEEDVKHKIMELRLVGGFKMLKILSDDVAKLHFGQLI